MTVDKKEQAIAEAASRETGVAIREAMLFLGYTQKEIKRIADVARLREDERENR